MAIWARPEARSRDTIPVRRVQDAEGLQRQYLWNTPNGTEPDFAATFADGDAILISWNALNNSVYDLWLTSWDLDTDPIALCLARAVNLTQDGDLKLITSSPPSSEMANTTQYALRFKPPTSSNGGGFVPSDPALSSPGFLLTRRTQQLSSSSSNTSDTSATASPTTRFRATTPSRQTVVPVPAAAGNGDGDTQDAAATAGATPDMTPAAAAGLTIGLILVVALLVTMEVAYLMWRRKKRRRQQRQRQRQEGGLGAGDSGGLGLGVSAVPSLRRSMATRSKKKKKGRWGLGRGRGRDGDSGRGRFVPVIEATGDAGVQENKAEMVMVGEDALWLSPELPGDSGWGVRLVHELQGSRTGRGVHPPGRPLTINSSVIELDAGRGG